MAQCRGVFPAPGPCYLSAPYMRALGVYGLGLRVCCACCGARTAASAAAGAVSFDVVCERSGEPDSHSRFAAPEAHLSPAPGGPRPWGCACGRTSAAARPCLRQQRSASPSSLPHVRRLTTRRGCGPRRVRRIAQGLGFSPGQHSKADCQEPSLKSQGSSAHRAGPAAAGAPQSIPPAACGRRGNPGPYVSAHNRNPKHTTARLKRGSCLSVALRPSHADDRCGSGGGATSCSEDLLGSRV